MNGQTTIVARASNMAARKGMLVVVAARKRGQWQLALHLLPGDADSVLTVGAVDTLGRVASFSGYGPSSDGQIKPDVAAVGWLAIVNEIPGNLRTATTALHSPAPIWQGIATCLWQAFPEVNNMEIRQTLRESSTRYGNPDDHWLWHPRCQKPLYSCEKRHIITKPPKQAVHWTSVCPSKRTTTFWS